MAPNSIALYLADDWGSACSMLRVLGPARALGWEVIQGSRWQARELVGFWPEAVDRADLVVIQRDFPRYAEAYESVMARARAGGKPVIYELDDLLPELPPENPVRPYYEAARLPMLRAALEASAVTVTSPALAEYLRPFNPCVCVLPNYLDDRLWQLTAPLESLEAGPVVIGYMGGFTHEPDVRMIKPVLQRCLETYGERVRLKFWSRAAPPRSIGSLRNVEWINIEIIDYAEFAAYYSQQRCHIALAPLRASAFNASKSAIKFLEYSAIGAAGVYSRLLPYESVVAHNQDGLLAGSLEEWHADLTQLIEDPGLRQRLAQAAQQKLREHWLLSDGAARWGDVYRMVRAKPAPAPAARSLAILQLVRRWMDEHDAELRQSAREEAAQLTGGPAGKAAHWLQSARVALAPAGSRRRRALDHLVQAWFSSAPHAGD